MTQLSLVFLGTGGSWPTVKRNVPSLAVKRGSEILLFDCGEGTQRQLQKSTLSYMQITKIFITHFHGDHFLGLPGLIQTMQLNDRDTPLHLYGPRGMEKLTGQLLTLGYFRPSFEIVPHEVTAGEELTFEGYVIRALKARHTVPALSYCLEERNRPGKFNKAKALELGIPEGPLFNKLQKGHTITLNNGEKISPDVILGPARKGRKIVVSGDTVPFEEMVEFARHADALVHEATFDSTLKDLSQEYGHTTALQAAHIAKEAEVERLWLIHISPRYLDHRILENDARTVFPHSYVPKDFQEIEIKLKK
ncbi:MAG TPA: ribonuclease Z [Candidatus Thermoplasmatota archaeon]|nr:ribonuclease Z [Candidatus Thermoplasmatota archaeon]